MKTEHVYIATLSETENFNDTGKTNAVQLDIG